MTTAATTAAARFGRAASRVPDLVFRSASGGLGWLTVAVLGLLGVLLVLNSQQVLAKLGISFLTGTTWDPIAGIYGALPFIVGPVASAFIAIVLATPIGLLTAIFLAELAPRRVAIPLTFTIELLAAIPSVVFGLWGVFVLSPFLGSTIEPFIIRWLGWIPIFAGPSYGIGLFRAG